MNDRFSVIPGSLSYEGSPLMEKGVVLLQLLPKLIFCCSEGDKAEILRYAQDDKKKGGDLSQNAFGMTLRVGWEGGIPSHCVTPNKVRGLLLKSRNCITLLELHPKRILSLSRGKTEILRFAQDDTSCRFEKGDFTPFDRIGDSSN